MPQAIKHISCYHCVMANAYTQIGIHIVTAVKGRRCLIHPGMRPRLECEMRRVLQQRRHFALRVHMQPDHVHAFVSMCPDDSVSNMVGAWKSQVSGFIQRELVPEFSWQRGYGAFAVGKAGWPTVKAYIDRQDEHHITTTFRQEYIRLLEKHQVEYDERYLFEEIFVG